MAEPLLELRGIRKSFGDAIVLDGVDLSIDPGESLVILGPSGTGKSTILRIMAGLLEPDEGEIYIKGQLCHTWAEDMSRPVRVSMVFQQSALFDSLTVDENVGFFLYQHSKLSRHRIQELVKETLELVGLPGIVDLYPAELSGGMRKRVSLARAILSDPNDPSDNPQILLYDEPTGGLDPIASNVIEDLIVKLQETARCETYVVVTHQDSTIRRTGKRLILLNQGVISWQGTVDQLDTTDNPYLRQFLSSRVVGPIETGYNPERSGWTRRQSQLTCQA